MKHSHPSASTESFVVCTAQSVLRVSLAIWKNLHRAAEVAFHPYKSRGHHAGNVNLIFHLRLWNGENTMVELDPQLIHIYWHGRNTASQRYPACAFLVVRVHADLKPSRTTTRSPSTANTTSPLPLIKALSGRSDLRHECGIGK